MTTVTDTTDTTAYKTVINGHDFWYEKLGTGPKILLLIPGCLGTARTDFYELLFGEHKLNLQEFTVIGPELQGYGRSRPPRRAYGSDVYNNDAHCCHQLMQRLGYQRYRLLGWSEGARVGLTMAGKYPDEVSRLIAMTPCILPLNDDQLNAQNALKNKTFNKMPDNIKQPYLRAYSEPELQRLWKCHVVFVLNYDHYFPGGCLDGKYDTIKCPTLIIHGDQDKFNRQDEPEYLLDNINGAVLKRFPKGSHCLHQEYRAEFKRIVEDFFAN